MASHASHAFVGLSIEGKIDAIAFHKKTHTEFSTVKHANFFDRKTVLFLYSTALVEK